MIRPYPGQRWSSDAEPELGLGTVRESGGGRVLVHFGATGVDRLYAWPGAPLRRMAPGVGDPISLGDGRRGRIAGIREEDGCRRYLLEGADEVGEDALADTLAASHPADRIRRGLTDSPEDFNLRIEALLRRAKMRQSPVRGFVGARIDLLPHQLAIAGEATARRHPRVLLADEVGLGKTIEAGLILQRLHLTGRAARVLVLVPEPLIHQWFVEMLRRFQLKFAIFDAERCESLGKDGMNPFLDSQLVLAPVGWLSGDEEAAAWCIGAGWDLLVVDEAHHLRWDEGEPSAAWQLVQRLAERVASVLLLTATPDQAGLASHFARLRILDPGRFADYGVFCGEMERHGATAKVAQALHSGGEPDAEVLAELTAGSPRMVKLVKAYAKGGAAARRALLDALLDSFGPGRVMFRNLRAALTGFPGRECHLKLLGSGEGSVRERKLDWLVGLLRRTGGEKVLLITATADEAEAVQEGLRERIAVDGAVFHERLTLLQRDRHAAWFTEPDGARLLMCSEIGSEGRNFQCARHLVLFDLPDDPALLEQRIGRLDRIGQTGTIQIHVPYGEGSREAVLAAWYDRALRVFGAHSPGAVATAAHFRERLGACLAAPGDVAGLEVLIGEAREFCERHARELEEGTAQLLALHSGRPMEVAETIRLIREADGDLRSEAFFLRLMDHFGMVAEAAEERTWVLRPDDVASAVLPEMPAEGMTVTADRARALAREDVGFLTVDHPLWQAALDALLGSEDGNACLAVSEGGAAALYCEAWYVAECVAPPSLHLDRFFPPMPIRVLVDHRLEDLSADRALIGMKLVPSPDPAAIAAALLASGRLAALMEKAERVASAKCGQLVEKARKAARAQFAAETARLAELARWPGHPAGAELEGLAAFAAATDAALSGSRLRLDALRIISRG